MSIKAISHIFDHSELAGSDLLMLIAIADNANEQGFAWPSIRTLQRKARYKSERGAAECIKRIERSGELAIEPRPGTSNMYWLTHYRLAQGLPPVPKNVKTRLPISAATPEQANSPPNASSPPPLNKLVHPTPELACSGEPSRTVKRTITPPDKSGSATGSSKSEANDDKAKRKKVLNALWDALVEAYPKQKSANGFMGKLRKFLLGEAHKKDGKWYEHQSLFVEHPATAEEVKAFAQWWKNERADLDAKKPLTMPTSPEILEKRWAEFRADVKAKADREAERVEQQQKREEQSGEFGYYNDDVIEFGGRGDDNQDD